MRKIEQTLSRRRQQWRRGAFFEKSLRRRRLRADEEVSDYREGAVVSASPAIIFSDISAPFRPLAEKVGTFGQLWDGVLRTLGLRA